MEKNEQGASCEFKENLSILREIDFFSELFQTSLGQDRAYPAQ